MGSLSNHAAGLVLPGSLSDPRNATLTSRFLALYLLSCLARQCGIFALFSVLTTVALTAILPALLNSLERHTANMPKTTKEIKIGRRYTCKVYGKESVVRVAHIDKSGYKKHSTVRIICWQEKTNKRVIFRSPARLIAELGEPIYNIKWGAQ